MNQFFFFYFQLIAESGLVNFRLLYICTASTCCNLQPSTYKQNFHVTSFGIAYMWYTFISLYLLTINLPTLFFFNFQFFYNQCKQFNSSIIKVFFFFSYFSSMRKKKKFIPLQPITHGSSHLSWPVAARERTYLDNIWIKHF